MPTRVFFNEPPEPFVILNYAEDLSSVCISVSHEDHADPVELFSTGCGKDIAEELQSKEGFSVYMEGCKKINLRYRRFLFKKKWRVMYEDVELSGIKVL
ncbi:MAG: hypothetical protein RB294_10810 [Bacteroidales bacterium]|jgi:hypothetical protein|nr:hypothetical protein [Bacteroidales bacterium]HPB01321.1 hypothetical protein [Bacteroidales bacterium]